MNNFQLQRLLDLIRRTGDRAIIMDPESDGLFVLMPMGEYEDWLDRAEYGSEETDGAFEDYGRDDIFGAEDATRSSPFPPAAFESNQTSSFQTPLPETSPSSPFALQWGENQPRAHSMAEEDLSDLPHEEEEEQFYLEPIDEN